MQGRASGQDRTPYLHLVSILADPGGREREGRGQEGEEGKECYALATMDCMTATMFQTKKLLLYSLSETATNFVHFMVVQH